jgi:single-strand DNA-binding protein
MLNSISIIGRLVRDAELKQAGQKDLLQFAVAVDKSYKEKDADFFRVKFWGDRAPKIAEYMKQGKLVAIEGRLTQERWEKDGVKKSDIVIVATNIHFIGGSKNDDSDRSEKFVRPGDVERILGEPKEDKKPDNDEIPF